MGEFTLDPGALPLTHQLAWNSDPVVDLLPWRCDDDNHVAVVVQVHGDRSVCPGGEHEQTAW